jgi:parallel beta-helix repeat protein
MRKLTWNLILMSFILVLVVMPFTASADNGKIEISQKSSTTFPIIIDNPGSYVLVSNLQVTTPGAIGILILADDVSLNLNGFAVVGDKGGGNDSRGIAAMFRQNIAISNGTVRNFFSDGVAVHGDTGKNSIIENLRVSDNGFSGIAVNYGIVENCVATNNGAVGINANFASVINCEAYNNGLVDQFYVSGIQARDSIIINCTADNNKSLGIYASDSTIIGCTANRNKNMGIWSYLHGYEYRGASSIVNCTANKNGSIGIRVDGESRVDGCNVRDNGEMGFFIVNQYNHVARNVISGNSTKNIVIVDPATNYVPVTGDNANTTW